MANRLKPFSKKREAELKEYSKRRKAFLEKNFMCAACMSRLDKHTIGAMVAKDVHHTRGRVGRLLNMEEFWMAVCRPHHDWIGANPEEARKRRWLCDKGQWNTIPK